MSTAAYIFSRTDDPESVTAEVALRTATGEPRVLGTTFHSNNHADALLRALSAAVRFAEKQGRAWEFVVNDKAVVRMVTGNDGRVGRLAAAVRQVAAASEGRIRVRYGQAREVFGEHAEQLW